MTFSIFSFDAYFDNFGNCIYDTVKGLLFNRSSWWNLANNYSWAEYLKM